MRPAKRHCDHRHCDYRRCANAILRILGALLVMRTMCATSNVASKSRKSRETRTRDDEMNDTDAIALAQQVAITLAVCESDDEACHVLARYIASRAHSVALSCAPHEYDEIAQDFATRLVSVITDELRNLDVID